MFAQQSVSNRKNPNQLFIERKKKKNEDRMKQFHRMQRYARLAHFINIFSSAAELLILHKSIVDLKKKEEKDIECRQQIY